MHIWCAPGFSENRKRLAVPLAKDKPSVALWERQAKEGARKSSVEPRSHPESLRHEQNEVGRAPGGPL